MPTLFTITVDTEEEWDWNAGWPTRNLSVHNIRELPRFQELCGRHGAAVTYFTNHAVLADPESRKVIVDLAKEPGVEIGMHIHPWNTPPLHHNGAVKARESFLHNLPDDVIGAKLATVYDAFAEHDLKPTSFRGGRYSTGGAVHEFLFDKGFRADCSVVPYTTWEDDGAPDYRHRGLLPKRLPPRQDGELPLWEVPLTLGYSRRPFEMWHQLFRTLERKPLRYLRLIGLFGKAGLVRKVWLNFEDAMGQDMLPWLARLRRMNLPCICFTLHSSSLMAGGSPYCPDRAARDRLFAYVDQILSVVRSWEDFQPATATDLAIKLEHTHANSRD